MNLKRAQAWYSGKYGYLLKLTISLSIFLIFLYFLDLKKVGHALEYVGPVELLVLLLLTIVRNLVGSLRFRVLSSVSGKIPFLEIIKQYFVASLFNNFLPTAIGGDSVRFVMISGCGVTKSDAGVMILLERLVGFYALISTSLAGALLWSPPTQIFSAIITLFTAYSAVMIFVVLDGFGLGRRLQNKYLASIRGAFSQYRGHYGTLLGTFALSVAYQAVSIYICYYIALAIGVQVPVAAFLALTPLVWFVTMIPISLGGIGLREVSFAYLFARVGVASEESTVISLGTYLTIVMSGFIGALFLFRARKEEKV